MITGGQLFDTNQNVAGNTAAIAGHTTAIADNTAAIAEINTQVGKGWNLTANDQDSTKIEAGATVDFSAEGDKIVVKKTGNSIKIGLAQDLAFNSVSTGNSTLNDDGLTITDGPSVTREGIAAGGKKITNVNAGEVSENSTDAVTGAQLHATNQTVADNKTAIAGNTAAIADNTTAITNNGNAITNINNELGKGFNFGDGSTTNKFALGDTIHVKGDSNVLSRTTADGVQLSLAKIVTVGEDNPVTVDGNAGTISGLTNVTFDANASYTGGKAATQEQLQAAYNSVSGVAGRGWNLTVDGADTTNVAPGDAVDFSAANSNIVISKTGKAVNVGQLREVQNLASAGWNIGDANGQVGQVAPGAEVKFVAGNTNTRVTVTQENGVSRVQVSAAPSPLQYTGTRNVSRFRSRTPDSDPWTPTNEVELVGAEPGAPVSLNNVAKARLTPGSLQAVNGEQVYVLGDSIAASLGGGSAFNPATGTVEAVLNVNGTVYHNVNDALKNIGAVAGSGWNLQVDDDTPTLVAPASTVNFKAGNNVVLERDGNNITVSANPTATFTTVNTEIVSARDVEVSQSVGVIDGPSLSREGINAAGTPIANVAPGTKGTDAVNVSQLNTGLSQLDGKIQRYKNDANAGTAAAMAMAGLPQAYLPGKSMFAIGGSTYQGQGGYAAGLSTVSENGKWVIKGTVAGSSRGQVGGSVGVGYQW